MKRTASAFVASALFLSIFFASAIPVLAQFGQPQTPIPTPSSTFSCPTTIRTVGQLLTSFTCFIGRLIVPALFTVAIAAFIYGVVMYVINADNSEKRTEGSKYMIWGIVALFVMVSVWGLVGVLGNTIGLDYATNPTELVPQLAE